MEKEFKIGVAISSVDKDVFLIRREMENSVQEYIVDLHKHIEARVFKMTSTEVLLRIKDAIDIELECRK